MFKYLVSVTLAPPQCSQKNQRPKLDEPEPNRIKLSIKISIKISISIKMSVVSHSHFDFDFNCHFDYLSCNEVKIKGQFVSHLWHTYLL